MLDAPDDAPERRGPTLSYSPPDPAAFMERIAADPRCAAITVDDRLHDAGKLVAVHVDLVGGLRADRASVGWLAGAGVDAVISSHGQLMAPIRHEGMTAIHRLLLTRRSQLDAAVAAIGRSGPNIVELLPGVLLPSVARWLPDFGVPLLAGGFIRTEDDVAAVLGAGALGATTSAPTLWGAA
jgi:glycerol uptake operon antiterminator